MLTPWINGTIVTWAQAAVPLTCKTSVLYASPPFIIEAFLGGGGCRHSRFNDEGINTQESLYNSVSCKMVDHLPANRAIKWIPKSTCNWE